jgi:hypothetical protein
MSIYLFSRIHNTSLISAYFGKVSVKKIQKRLVCFGRCMYGVGHLHSSLFIYLVSLSSAWW